MAREAGSGACSVLARSTPEKATIEPTDRSIPPEMITNVMPAAITALIEVCSRTFSRLDTVRKYGLRIESRPPSNSSPSRVPT